MFTTQHAKLLLGEGANLVVDTRYHAPSDLKEMVRNETPQTEHLLGHLTIRGCSTLDIKVMIEIAMMARKRVTFEP